MGAILLQKKSGKVPKKLLHKRMKYFEEKKSLSPNQNFFFFGQKARPQPALETWPGATGRLRRRSQCIAFGCSVGCSQRRQASLFGPTCRALQAEPNLLKAQRHKEC